MTEKQKNKFLAVAEDDVEMKVNFSGFRNPIDEFSG